MFGFDTKKMTRPDPKLTFKKLQDLLHWSEATEAFKAGESNSHLWLVVGVWIVLRKLSM